MYTDPAFVWVVIALAVKFMAMLVVNLNQDYAVVA